MNIFIICALHESVQNSADNIQVKGLSIVETNQHQWFNTIALWSQEILWTLWNEHSTWCISYECHSVGHVNFVSPDWPSLQQSWQTAKSIELCSFSNKPKLFI